MRVFLLAALWGIALWILLVVLVLRTDQAWGARPVHPAHLHKVWVCPELPDGSQAFSRKLCVLEVRR
jgi:hypothetical protein